MAGEDTGSAIAQDKSGKANYPGDRQEILADIALQIQPLPHCATQIVHRIVELPTLETQEICPGTVVELKLVTELCKYWLCVRIPTESDAFTTAAAAMSCSPSKMSSCNL